MTEIEHQKEQKQKTKKDQEEKSTLQRSKTFVNLLFKAGRKKDASRGRSKSPGDKPGKGSADVCKSPPSSGVASSQFPSVTYVRAANGRDAQFQDVRRGGGHGPQAAGRGGGSRRDEDVQPGERLQTETFRLRRSRLHCESLMHSM